MSHLAKKVLTAVGRFLFRRIMNKIYEKPNCQCDNPVVGNVVLGPPTSEAIRAWRSAQTQGLVGHPELAESSPPPKVPQVQEMLGHLNNAMEALEQSTAELQKRLIPVLKPEPRGPERATEKPSATVTVAAQIEAQAIRVASCHETINDLIRLLEV